MSSISKGHHAEAVVGSNQNLRVEARQNPYVLDQPMAAGVAPPNASPMPGMRG